MKMGTTSTKCNLLHHKRAHRSTTVYIYQVNRGHFSFLNPALLLWDIGWLLVSESGGEIRENIIKCWTRADQSCCCECHHLVLIINILCQTLTERSGWCLELSCHTLWPKMMIEYLLCSVPPDKCGVNCWKIALD